MVGREVLLRVEKTGEPGDALLRVKDLHVHDERGLEAVRGISFDVRAGEIVGIAGVDGNGQRELIDALTGLRRSSEGESDDLRQGHHERGLARLHSTWASAHPGGPAAARLVLDFSWPRTSRCTTTARSRTRVGVALPEAARRARARGCSSSTCAAAGRQTRRRALGWQSTEGRRRA